MRLLVRVSIPTCRLSARRRLADLWGLGEFSNRFLLPSLANFPQFAGIPTVFENILRFWVYWGHDGVSVGP